MIDRFPDEYDPLKPNDYQKFVKRRREGKHKVTRYAEQKKAQERETKRERKAQRSGSDSSSDEEPDKRRRAVGMGKVSRNVIATDQERLNVCLFRQW